MTLYQRGDRVALIHTDDPYTDLRPGDEGVVTLVDGTGTVHVEWDKGNALGLIPGVDRFRRVAITENDEEPSDASRINDIRRAAEAESWRVG